MERMALTASAWMVRKDPGGAPQTVLEAGRTGRPEEGKGYRGRFAKRGIAVYAGGEPTKQEASGTAGSEHEHR